MISKVKVRRDWTRWHPWFAWYPVEVRAGGSQMYVWVWWRAIERRYDTPYGEFTNRHLRLRKPT